MRPKTKEPQVIAITADTMRKRGLTRDKANYVMSVVRMRQEVRAQMRQATDPAVVAELLCLDEFFECSITDIYGPPPIEPPTQGEPA